MRPGKRRALDKATAMGDLLNRLEKTKADIRSKVEHPFCVTSASSATSRCAAAVCSRTPRN